MLEIGVLLLVISPYTALIPAAWMLYKVIQNRMTLFMNPLNIGVVLLFVVSVISGIINKDVLSMTASAGLLLYLGTCLFIQSSFDTEKKAEKLLHKVYIWSLIPLSLGFIEKFASYYIDMRWVSDFFWSPTYIPTKEAYRIYSTFGNPNMAGTWFAAMFLISIYFLKHAKAKHKPFYGIVTALYILATVFTGSKGAAVGLELAIFVYAVFSRSKKSKILLSTVFATVIVIALAVPEMNHTLNPRDALWHKCIELYRNKPLLGNGLFGIFREIGEVHGHNIWITIMTTLGISGLSIYLGMKVYLINSVRTLYSKGSQLVPMLASIQMLYIGHGLVDFTVLTPQGGMLFFIVSGLLSALVLQYDVVPTLNWTDLTGVTLKEMTPVTLLQEKSTQQIESINND